MGKKSGPKFYAVHTGRGGFRGVVDDWPTCRRLVSGVRGAVFKSFATRAEAAVFAEAGRGRTAGGPPSAAVQHSPPPAAAGRAAQARSERGAGVVTAAAGASTVVVYTDGACTNNGRRHARAGVGVYFGPADAMNLSQPLQGESQTNQRAEQTGVLRAMQLAVSQRRVKRGDTLVIRTDSNYTVKGLLSWMVGWKARDWKASTGLPVQNTDLWRELDAARNEVEAAGVVLKVEWIKGHAGHEGNEAADRLAVAGTTRNM